MDTDIEATECKNCTRSWVGGKDVARDEIAYLPCEFRRSRCLIIRIIFTHLEDCHRLGTLVTFH
jgi:hypothetical protein